MEEGLFFNIPSQLDHIGIAVRDLAEGVNRWLTLFRFIGAGGQSAFKVSGEAVVEEYEVKAVMVQREGMPLFEFISPAGKGSLLWSFLRKRGEGVHHLCFRVSDIKLALRVLGENGVELLDKKPRKGAFHRKIAFIHPKSFNGVLIELCES